MWLVWICLSMCRVSLWTSAAELQQHCWIRTLIRSARGFFYNVLLDKKERRRRKKKKSFSHKNLKTSGLRAEREHAHFSSAPHFFYCRQESLHHAASRCYGPLVCQKAAKKMKAEQTEEPEGNNAPWSESRQEPLFNHIPLRIIAKVD